MDNLERFQKKLVELRKTKGFSQASFGRALGISRRMMCYYEKESTTFPPCALVLNMAKLLDCNIDTLFALKKEENDGRTVEAKSLQKLKKAAKLPKKDRDLLFQLMDNLLEKNKKTATSR